MAVLQSHNLEENCRPLKQEHECKKMLEEEDEETLSLSDLPTAGRHNCESHETSSTTSTSSGKAPFDAGDFEFGSWVEEDPTVMCTADEVFCHGRILPLRPSVSSESGLTSGFRSCSQSSIRCGSRSESMGRSLSKGSSRVFSGSRSSSCSSRSHSLSSRSGSYSSHSLPSPKPQMAPQARLNAAQVGRKSSGWGLFRSGLVRTPATTIELQHLRLRSRNGSIRRNGSCSSSAGRRKSTGSDIGKKREKQQHPEIKSKPVSRPYEQGLQRFLGLRFGCKCSADAVEAVPSPGRRIVVLKSRRRVATEGEEEPFRKQTVSSRRTFEWLKQLSIAEAPSA